MLKRSLKTAVVMCTLSIALTATAQAGTLENLERERSTTINYFLDANMEPNERLARVEASKRRLLDMERMVLRDKSLRGKSTPVVRRAFSNYDVTFLAHAATEKDLSMVDNWLEQFDVSTDALMAAKVGRR